MTSDIRVPILASRIYIILDRRNQIQGDSARARGKVLQSQIHAKYALVLNSMDDRSFVEVTT